MSRTLLAIRVAAAVVLAMLATAGVALGAVFLLDFLPARIVQAVGSGDLLYQHALAAVTRVLCAAVLCFVLAGMLVYLLSPVLPRNPLAAGLFGVVLAPLLAGIVLSLLWAFGSTLEGSWLVAGLLAIPGAFFGKIAARALTAGRRVQSG